MDDQKLRELIILFLEINCEPADAQVHALASALGIDHESLEAVMYKMMGEAVEEDDVLADVEDDEDDILIEAADEDVLNEVAVDNDMLPLDDIPMNDGDNTNDDLGFQQETSDDGPDVHDIGVGMSSGDSSDVLTDDGVPIPPEI
jgi:hypothetical protein